jgi:hypothetical protein
MGERLRQASGAHGRRDPQPKIAPLPESSGRSGNGPRLLALDKRQQIRVDRGSPIIGVCPVWFDGLIEFASVGCQKIHECDAAEIDGRCHQ